ncbi:MAG: hypothetical protein HRT89_17995 [Lentisphaeria bacterium]|nr:hypothetical protein [Lentisphaeria bacterium]NQZ69949.1 hypothetical protein [Lentisphaeria bacterium]
MNKIAINIKKYWEILIFITMCFLGMLVLLFSYTVFMQKMDKQNNAGGKNNLPKQYNESAFQFVKVDIKNKMPIDNLFITKAPWRWRPDNRKTKKPNITIIPKVVQKPVERPKENKRPKRNVRVKVQRPVAPPVAPTIYSFSYKGTYKSSGKTLAYIIDESTQNSKRISRTSKFLEVGKKIGEYIVTELNDDEVILQDTKTGRVLKIEKGSSLRYKTKR